MNPEAPANLMSNLIGRRIRALIDPNNDDLLVKFNKACFAFFSPYRVYPELASIESLQEQLSCFGDESHYEITYHAF